MWLFGNIDGQRVSGAWQSNAGPILAFTVVAGLIVGQVALSQNPPLRNTGKGASSPVRVDEKGRKFVNKIPYDVFFDNPVELVRNNTNTVTPASDGAPNESRPNDASTAANSKPSAPVPTAAKSSGSEWHQMIPMEELQGEVKSVRNSLTKAMSNQGSYNSNFKEIAIDGSELAALAAIVLEHSDSLTWKEKAPYVRDFAGQLSQSAVGLGKDNFEKSKSAFQKLTSVLDGSVPADAGDVPQSRPFNEAASRKGLMKRIERAKNFLKQDVNSEAKFKSLSDQIRREAALISALGTVITTSGYEYTSEDDYQQHAKTLIDGGKEAFSSTQEQEYDRFKEAVDKVNKSCTDCHASYGNG